jgi:hypothetical protein
MEIINFEQLQFTKIGAKGICPHCSVSVFEPVGAGHREMRTDPKGGQAISI